MAVEQAEKKARTRSPAYPAVGLEEAIERVRRLYAQDKTAGSTQETAMRHMGFAKPHGHAYMVLSALRKFGLVDYNGDRAFVTKRAVEILTFPESHERRKAAIQEAALAPTIYRQLLEKYKDTGLPSDETLEAILIADHGFNSTAVSAFLKDFRASLEYAGLLSDTVLALPSESESGQKEQEEPIGQDDQRTARSSPTSIAPPRQGAKLMAGERELTTGLLSKNASFRLIVSGEVGVKEIERLIAKLELDKEILAEPEPDPPLRATEDSAVNPPSPAPKQGWSIMITQAERARLREQGYSDEQIAKMKPEEAHHILGLQ